MSNLVFYTRGEGGGGGERGGGQIGPLLVIRTQNASRDMGFKETIEYQRKG